VTLAAIAEEDVVPVAAAGDTVTLADVHAVAAKVEAAPEPKTQTPRNGTF
jgi:hypothetical protein